MGFLPVTPENLGHYRIVEKLSEGGWGTVYLAHDERLDRDVALKVLSVATLANEDDRKRFRKEALTLAKLNHTNIGQIYDFDTQAGVDFLVMEYVSGGTLSRQIAGPALSEKEVAGLGIQIAQALEEAHEYGIIHRDLKPANIAVTLKGQVKVLDFGLAKLFDPSRGGLKAETLTQSVDDPHLVGTLPYMAPEQVSGERMDARTDIYALGVVLYEMATHQRPFREDSMPRLFDSILHQPVAPPRGLNPRISAEMERIILKCLEKDPGRRYQSAKEVGVDLRRLLVPTMTRVSSAIPVSKNKWKRWAPVGAGVALSLFLAIALSFDLGGIRGRTTGRPSPPIRSIAVLPLENFSHDAEQEYFSDGMTEALIAELAKIKALKVISRTSVMQYKGTKKPLPQIARELNVDGIIEGSVVRDGNQARINVQLIDGTTDQHIWADNFQREMHNLLSLQGEVASSIARKIQVAVTPEEQLRLASGGVVNPEAHDLVLKAKYLAEERTKAESLEKAEVFLQQAIKLDPNSAPAYAALSSLNFEIAEAGYKPMLEVCPEFRAVGERAIALDTMLGDALSMRAWAKLYCDWDWAGAEADARDALQLSPGSSVTHSTLAWVLNIQGKYDESLEQNRIAQQLDPVSVVITVQRAMYFYNARRYDESVSECHKALAFSPESVFAKWQLGTTLTAMRKYDEAIQVFLSRKVPTANTNWMLGHAYGKSGKMREAREVLNFLLEKRKNKYLWPTIIAVVYSGMGDKDHAFEWLETAYKEHEYWLPKLRVDPMFDPLRSDPRFAELVKRMNFPR
jgi:serine/threonine protein kinase/tetratricopeptide (TPR) repeat protein